MSDHVTEIREGAFYNCDALKTVTLSKNLRVIGSYAFWGCKSLENIVLPNGLKEIGRDAFADSFKLQLYLPDSLEKLDPRYNHFKGCHSVYLSSRLVYRWPPCLYRFRFTDSEYAAKRFRIDEGYEIYLDRQPDRKSGIL